MRTPRSLKKLLNSLRKRVPLFRAWFPEESSRHWLHNRLGNPLPALPNLPALFRRHGIRPRGVLHLGAPEGPEMDSYLAMGFEHVEVRRLTLDRLMAEEGPIPADYNFLILDIQGAGLMALRGASDCLARVDAITIKISLVEPAERGLLLGQVETHLHGCGFHRVAQATPWHPTWDDALYVRRPAVTMTSLGRNGRFGNQLFQYAFIRLVAERQGAALQTPEWVGQALFGFDDPLPLLTFPEVREPARTEANPSKALPEESRYVNETIPGFGSADFWGYFMTHTGMLLPHREKIREWFTPVEGFRRLADAALEKLRRERRRIIAVHLRRGDYGYGMFFRAPCAWYEQWAAEQGFDPAECLVYVCAEDAKPYLGRFPGHVVRCARDVGISDEMAVYFDYYMLTQADEVAIANSSYSFFAAMMNSRAGAFVRPCHDAGRLIPFDPWNATVVLGKQLTEEEHQRLREED